MTEVAEVTFVQMAIKAKLEYSRIFQTQGWRGMGANWRSDKPESLTTTTTTHPPPRAKRGNGIHKEEVGAGWFGAIRGEG